MNNVVVDGVDVVVQKDEVAVPGGAEKMFSELATR